MKDTFPGVAAAVAGAEEASGATACGVEARVELVVADGTVLDVSDAVTTVVVVVDSAAGDVVVVVTLWPA